MKRPFFIAAIALIVVVSFVAIEYALLLGIVALIVWLGTLRRRRVFLIVFAILGALAGIGWWYVFYTTAGVEFALARVANLKSMRIVAEGVTGHLAGPLTIDRVTIDHKQARIVVDKLTFDLSPAALLAQRVQVDTATIERVSVNATPSSQSDGKPPRFFPSFLQLAVDNADIQNVRVTNNDGFVQTARRVRGQLRLTAQSLQASGIQIDGPFYTATGTFAIRAQRPLQLRLDAQARMPVSRGPDFAAQIELSGPINKLHLDAILATPSTARLQADIIRGEKPWQLLGELTSDRFALDPWLQKPPFSLQDLAVTIDMAPDGIHVVGNVLTPEFDELPLQLDLRGQYANRVIAITRGELRPTKSDTVIIAAARIDMSDRRPVIAGTAQWTNFRWPLRADYFTSPEGQLSIFGTLPFDIGINAELRTVRNLSGHLLAHGVLTDAAIDFDDLTLTALDGEVKGAARLGFAAPREWRAAITGTRLNPVALSAELPGRIDFKVDAAGTGLDPKANFSINLPALKGTLRGEQVDGHGSISHDARGWSAKEFLLRLGANRFAANGEWRERIDLAWSLEIPSLERFVQNAAGAIRFQGTAHGSQTRPQIAGSFSAHNARYGAWNSAELAAAGNIDLSDRLASQLEITGRSIGWGDQRLDTVKVGVHGKASAHTIEIVADTTRKDTISTSIEGAYANSAWRGKIAPFALTDAEGRAPTVNVQQANAAASKERVSVENVCALWTDRKVCGSGAWSQGEGWHLDAHSDPFPLSIFNGTFPDESRYQGDWQVDAHLSSRAAMLWTGGANVQVRDATLTYQPIAGAEEIVRLGTGRVDITAESARFLATLKIVTPGTTSIDAAARLERNAAVEIMQSPMSGELRAHTADANLLPIFFPDLDRSAGELTADLRVHGTPAAPLVQGQINLQKGELDLYRYNLSMRALNATTRIADNRLAFEGRANLGAGELAMNGDFEWRNREPIGKLHLQGTNLLVADLPEYRIVASPNVDFKVDGRRVDATGEVVIPSAHIEPHDLRGAVQRSSDVRLIGDRPDVSTRGFDVHSDVRMRLGDDVELDTYGLQGKLRGAVAIVADGVSAIGRGELNVSDGLYEAYGQKLDIARGRLLFDASPLDNPGLDIQAARKIEERRVGVNVRGTLRAPRVTFFSEPALPQSQIVSMLLTGKPIADLSTRDTATVGAQQDDLKLQGGSVLASQIGRRLGLEEVGVESTGLNDAALVLGKFLSPRLFVSYGISLTESINTLKLRYTLSDHWLIKTEAGQNQSADVEFRIER